MAHRPRTRVVGYSWQSTGAPLTHEDEATALLNRALAAGVVSPKFTPWVATPLCR